MAMKIEKGVPIPVQRQAAAAVYPFAQMQIGDSFRVPLAGATLKAAIARLKYAAKRYTDDECASFSVLVRPEGDGLRCWRVEYKPRKTSAPALAVADRSASYVHRMADDETPEQRGRGPGRPRKES